MRVGQKFRLRFFLDIATVAMVNFEGGVEAGF